MRIDYARQPGRTRGVSAADEELIEDFRNKAAGNLSDGTIKNAAADLRHLSARLSDAGRPSIADRIRRELENAQLENPDVENHQLEAELDEDVDTYAKDRRRRIKAALKKLREVGAGNTLATDVRRLAPHADDATLIRMWAAAEKATHRIDPKTIDRQTRRMFRLSEWLQTNDRPPIAGRLSTPGLAQDVEAYKRETEDSSPLLRIRVILLRKLLGRPTRHGSFPQRRPRRARELGNGLESKCMDLGRVGGRRRTPARSRLSRTSVKKQVGCNSKCSAGSSRETFYHAALDRPCIQSMQIAE
ncbi:hypothetical protein [Bradyrhizobium nanningense]|uniref:hypothetical protein n=1 Tax=Bradyrhizobium nanningense TaxID=1325118 RepID=UPI001FE042AC|nr:hypothetical protein [Bradyrhizobium nanningense]